MIAAFALLLFLLQDAESLSARALEAAQARQPAEAEKLWRQALASSPDLYSANFNLAFLLYSQQRWAEAEPLLARAAKAEPKEFNAWYLLGVVRSRLEATDDALRAWREALSIQPANLKLMQVMAVEYGKGRYFRESAALAERALAIKADDSAIWLLAIQAWQDAGEDTAALRMAEGLVKRFPELPRAQFEYGYGLYRAGRVEEGLSHLRKAMEATPPWEEPFFFYGDILLRQGKVEEALEPLARAIELRPDYMVARVTLARALMRLARNDQARKVLDDAIALDPRHPQPHLLLSQLLFRMGDEAGAARAKDTSLRLRRENPQAMEADQGRPFPGGVERGTLRPQQ